MSKEKQIEEMADVLERAKVNACATIGSMNSSFGMVQRTRLRWMLVVQCGYFLYRDNQGREKAAVLAEGKALADVERNV